MDRLKRLLNQNLIQCRIERRTALETFISFVVVVSQFINLFYRCESHIAKRVFIKKWLKKDRNKNRYFDFYGIKLPDIVADHSRLGLLRGIFKYTFLYYCFYDDNYDKSIVNAIVPYYQEAPYCYIDDDFRVIINPNDIVIDAGAWIGDFSAYAAKKGAIVYAFEPENTNFEYLCKTSELNENRIYPVKKGLGNDEFEVSLFIDPVNTGGNTMLHHFNESCETTETINITTLDKFVEENNIKKIDFIKADIEGAERDMLRGASKVLKKFAPKLAICTYHLPDDPEILEKIILEANPAYKIVHLGLKLFASI